MVEPQTSRFWMAARQSGLLDVDGLAACWNAIPLEKRDALEHLDRRLARQAVQQNLLTLWQAQQLLAGRTSGFQVDRYLLLELIGQGGMGRVYLARDTRLNRLVALKILAPERMNNARAVERFKREARVGAQLQHENLVRIYDFVQANGRFFLVMEYIEGKTIGALITAQGPMPVTTAARLTWQIAMGLEHAHRKGLIHRDVNPYNILVTHDGIAKLADLGLAIDLADDERVTREGATVGTFDYVAPEQARHSHAADIRSDIYSLGCTLYHMVTGQVPFPSPSLPEKLFAHQALEPTSVDQLVPGISPEFTKVVQQMMRKQPEDRYDTPLHLAQALEPFLENQVRAHNNELEPLPLLPDGDAESPVARQLLAKEDAGQTAAPVLGVEPPPQLATSPGGVGTVPYLSRGQVALSEGAGPSTSSPAVAPQPVLTPLGEHEVNSTEDIPLILDLGPEPSLSDSLSRPRPWFTSSKPSHSQIDTMKPGAAENHWPGLLRKQLSRLAANRLWWLALTIGALALLVTILALTRWLGEQRSSSGNQQLIPAIPGKHSSGHGASDDPDKSGVNARHDGAEAAADITVVVGENEETPAKNLFEAMERALGSDGTVILHNREPLMLLAKDSSRRLIGSGYVKLQAAPGVNAVLAVELNGKDPFLTVGPTIHLRLEGLTFRSSYGKASAGTEAATCPLLYVTGGPALLNHCAFELANDRDVVSSCAVAAEGGNLVVENCWFKGYHNAIKINAVGGVTTIVKQTMIVRGMPPSAGTGSPGAPIAGTVTSPANSWALRVEYMSGNQNGSARKVILDHCTIASSGLLQLAGFTPEFPLQLEVSNCAVRTGVLVNCESTSAENAIKSLQWNGRGNWLDVTTPVWWTRQSKDADSEASVVLDRSAWLRLARELQPENREIKFSGMAVAHPEALEPSDYSIDGIEPGTTGARPDQIGPEVERSRKKGNQKFPASH